MNSYRSSSKNRFDVVVVGYWLHGQVTGPADVPLQSIVVRLLPSTRYTTPDSRGRFAFYNVREGQYQVALDLSSLPEYAVMKTPVQKAVTLAKGETPGDVRFDFEIRQAAIPGF